MRTIASVVLGMPEDTKESMWKTIKFVQELKLSYAIFSLGHTISWNPVLSVDGGRKPDQSQGLV